MTAWLMFFFRLMGMRMCYDTAGNECMMNVFLFSWMNGFSMAHGHIWVDVC